MAVADLARRRLRLNRSELDAVAALHADDGADAARTLTPALEQAGLMAGGHLAPWADELLTVIARPALAMSVELFTQPPINYPIWAVPSVVVLGEPGPEGTVELAAMEPITLPYALSLLVGLRRRSQVDAKTLHIGHSDFAELQQRLAGGLEPDERYAALTDLLRAERLSWRVSSVWADPAGQHPMASVHVIDTDDRGLWTVKNDGQQLVMQPASAADVWRQIMDLLPKVGVKA